MVLNIQANILEHFTLLLFRKFVCRKNPQNYPKPKKPHTFPQTTPEWRKNKTLLFSNIVLLQLVVFLGYRSSLLLYGYI